MQTKYIAELRRRKRSKAR